ncbi:MAG: agmatine deiminase family protein [Ferruginibacter sp.]|nr:agmatine deiminase family protein [Ferruginibacter sp.]
MIRYKHLLTGLFILASFICDAQVEALRMPAEWEQQQGIFVNYAGNPNDPELSVKVQKVCREIIRELAAVTKVYVLINEEVDRGALKRSFLAEGIQVSNIKLLPVSGLFSMGVPRDYGPIIVKNTRGDNKIIRFQWDYVGADFLNPDTAWARRRDRIRARYFNQVSKLLNLTVQPVPLMLEGGEIEFNGKGLALLVDSFTLGRNPLLTKQQQDSLLRLSLGVSKITWLREGVAEDPGAGRKAKIVDNIYGFGVGGHVDEFARFVNDTTLFLAMPSAAKATVDPVKRITLERMKINAEILRKSTDQNGRPLNIIYIPVPDVIPETHIVDSTKRSFPVRVLQPDFPEWKQGDTIRFLPAVSYLNFLVFNHLVLIPKYWRPGFPASSKQKDEAVCKIFAAYFPGKKIVQIDTWGINLVGGGIHCWTQPIPSE